MELTTTTVTIYVVIAACAQALSAIFGYLTARFSEKTNQKTKRENKIDAAETVLDKACDGGSIDDLI